MSNALRDIIDFNDSLRVGMLVEIRWTNNGYYNTHTGRISKLNKNTARVKIDEPFTNGLSTWPAGFEFVIQRPLITNPLFTANNGIYPLV